MERAKSGQDAPFFGFCLAKNSLSWLPFLKQMCLVLMPLPLPLVPSVVHLPLLLCFWPLITLSILAGTSCQWIPTSFLWVSLFPETFFSAPLGRPAPCPALRLLLNLFIITWEDADGLWMLALACVLWALTLEMSLSPHHADSPTHSKLGRLVCVCIGVRLNGDAVGAVSLRGWEREVAMGKAMHFSPQTIM